MRSEKKIEERSILFERVKKKEKKKKIKIVK